MASSLSKSIDMDVREENLNYEQEFVESFVIVYLDIALKRNDHAATTIKKQLQVITDDVEIFDDANPCIDYITDLKNTHVLFIVSEPVNQQFIPILAQDLSNVAALYILCSSKEDDYYRWLESLRKVKGIYTVMTELIKQIKSDLRRIKHELIGFEVIDIPSILLPVSGKFNQQEYSFMHSNLLKVIFLKCQDNSISEMAEYCRTVYAGNASQLEKIDEFERDYEPNKAVSWYTRDSFVHKEINRALRTRDVNALYSMRTFLRHLHQQISQLCPIGDHPQSKSVLKLYRGQRMPIEEFEKLKNNEGGLFSVSNFLSTSTNRELAFFYAGKSDEETMAIVFELVLNLNCNTNSSFACINQLSHFGESEHEWLFSMGTVFRIGKIELLDNIWHIRLTLTNDHDENLEKLTVHMSKIIQIQRPNPLVPLCRLFARMGEYKKAIELCQKHASSENGWEMKATLYDTLAWMHANKRDNNRALYYHQQALDVVVEHVDKNEPLLASYHNNLAISYEGVERDDLALKHYRVAVDLELRALQPDYLCVAYSYDSMGSILSLYFEGFDEAINCYTEALKLMLLYLPSNHSDILSLYNDMADVYVKLNNTDEALSILYKCLREQRMCSECNLHDLALTCERIAEIYEKKGKTKEASLMWNKYHKLENAWISSKKSEFDNLDIDSAIAQIFGSEDAFLSAWNISLTS